MSTCIDLLSGTIHFSSHYSIIDGVDMQASQGNQLRRGPGLANRPVPNLYRLVMHPELPID